MTAPAAPNFRWITGALAMALLAASGCQHAPGPRGDGLPTPEPIGYAVLRDAQNDRVRRIPTVRASGVIELRWRDEQGGSHFEQGDIRLFLRLPDRLSLQVHKLGETYLWFGADGGSCWLFDLLNKDDRVLYVGAASELGGRAEVPGALHPLRLIDLLGLTELPEDGVVTYSPEHDAWQVESTAQGGTIRLYFDRQTLLPRRVEGVAGTVIECAGELREYESLAVDGLPPGYFPRIPTRARLTDARHHGEAAVALGELTTRINERAFRNAFDLEQLTRTLAPHRRVSQ